MNMQTRKYRMYGLVPYNISPIQQGIQFGHAVVEYGLQFGTTEAYRNWARRDKTFIILNGGTTNTNPLSPGTLNLARGVLDGLQVPYAEFFEPDLGDQLTAFVFLVDDRIWDRDRFPSVEEGGSWMDQQRSSSYYYQRIWGDDWKTCLEMRNWLSNLRLA